MTRPRGLIEILKADVRVSPMEFSPSDQFSLLVLALKPLADELHRNKGGPGFEEWHKETIEHSNSKHALWHYSLILHNSFRPQHDDYSILTRIRVLNSDYFRLPNLDLPKDGKWYQGDRRLVVRLVITNVGKVFLEWHEAIVISEKIDITDYLTQVTPSIYLPVPLYDLNNTEEEREAKALLKKLFNKTGFIIGSLMGINHLLDSSISWAQSRLNDFNRTKKAVERTTILFDL